MASMKETIERALRQAEQAQAAAEQSDELPDLRDDPWFYLDPVHGDERLRRLMQQEPPA
jgi:hypothetical protein